MHTVIHLDPLLPRGSRDLPLRKGETPYVPSKECTVALLGLAPGGVYHAQMVAHLAVRSYRTLSPLPILPIQGIGRFAFCGTFPRVAPAGRYPAPLSRGARTFLTRPKNGTKRNRPTN